MLGATRTVGTGRSMVVQLVGGSGGGGGGSHTSNFFFCLSLSDLRASKLRDFAGLSVAPRVTDGAYS
jgi:hypothetical protein